MPFPKVSWELPTPEYPQGFLSLQKPHRCWENQSIHSTGAVSRGAQAITIARGQVKEKGYYRGLPWGGPSLSPIVVWLDFIGHLIHPPVFSQGVLCPKTYVFFKSSWEGSFPLPAALHSSNCSLYLMEICKLQPEFSMSWASLLEGRRFGVNMLQRETHHNTPNQSQWSLLGRKLILKEGGNIGVICNPNYFFIVRRFQVLLRQIKMNNNIK